MFCVLRLFFGSGTKQNSPLNISSILIVKTNNNFRDVIKAITLFDNIVSFYASSNLKKTIASDLLLKSRPIISHLLYDEDRTKLDPFIYSCWNSLIQNKTEIKINPWKLNKKYGSNDTGKQFLSVVFGNDWKYIKNESKDDIEYFIPDQGSSTNMLPFDMFTNLKKITIEMTQCVNEYWPFSIPTLLKLILNNKNKIEKVYIDVLRKHLKTSTSWISFVYDQQKEYIVTECEKSNLKVEFKNHGRWKNKHLLLIKKAEV